MTARSKQATGTIVMFIVTAIIVPVLGWSLAQLKTGIDQRLDEIVNDVEELQRDAVMRIEYEYDQRKLTDRINSVEGRIYEIYRER